jgi:hypothetical protein
VRRKFYHFLLHQSNFGRYIYTVPYNKEFRDSTQFYIKRKAIDWPHLPRLRHMVRGNLNHDFPCKGSQSNRLACSSVERFSFDEWSFNLLELETHSKLQFHWVDESSQISLVIELILLWKD